MQITDKHKAYWRRNLRIVSGLLLVWFIATFAVAYFARPLAEITIPLLQFPLSFYMAAQGSLIVYVILVWYYARKMRALDEQYDVAERDE